ncbi:MAG: hypothetical protein R3B09_07055 [Nannocystaceae bacterium]
MSRQFPILLLVAPLVACGGDDTVTSASASESDGTTMSTTGDSTTTTTVGSTATTTAETTSVETSTTDATTTDATTTDATTTDATTTDATTTDATTTDATTMATTGPACVDDEACAALADACNDGVCQGGTCVAAPLDDGTACADGDVCNGDETCQAGVCAPGTPLACDDGAFCNGEEGCDAGTGCVAGEPPALSDDIECTVDACDEDLDMVVHTPDDGLCNGDVCSVGVCDAKSGCMNEDNPYLVCLNGDPDPSTVFNTIESTYYFSNNLSNTIWHAGSNQILSGHYSQLGYYAFPAEMNDYPQFPDQAKTERYTRLIHIPGTRTAIHGDTQFAIPASAVRIGDLDPDTGVISGMQPAVFSDGFNGNCNLISNDNTRFFCYDGSGVRKYDTAEGSPNLTFVETVALSQPPLDLCDTFCFGGTFAWDGKYYYFPYDGNSSSDRRYSVYDATGALVQTYTATGNGAIDGTYFDWSVGHYTIHDGFGGRSGGNIYTWGQNGDDSQCYGPKSLDHE